MVKLLRPSNERPRRAPAWFALFEAQPGASAPLRERVCEVIRGAIQAGHVRHGDRLPATRTLASDLKISRITAESAYQQLEAEGYVRRRVGDGTFVDIDVATAPRAGATASRPVTRGGRKPWSDRGTLIVKGGGCHDPRETRAFSAGFPDLDEFPLDIWKRLTARRLRRSGTDTLGYGDPAGEPILRAAIAKYLLQSRGVQCSADQVVVLTSSQQALQIVATMLTDPGDAIWMEEPGYRGAQTALVAMGASLTPVPVDGEGMTIPRGRTPSPRLVYVTPSHQYPMGVTLSLARRLRLIEQVRRHGGWIIEDDYDSEFEYDARPVPAMQGLDSTGRVLYLGTFTKVLFPSLRLAYLVLPPALVDGFITARTAHDGHPARLSQLVTADFLEDGHFAAHVRRMRRIYHQRRDLLVAEISRHLAPWCRPIAACGGLQLTVQLPRGKESALTARAARAGVATPGIKGLCLSHPKRDGWLLGYAALKEEEIIDAVRRLSAALGSPRAGTR